MEQLLRDLSSAYADDPSAPGVQVAWLPDEEHYYAAVHRYRGPRGELREVVCCRYEPTLERAVAQLHLLWRSTRA